ncbi:MAG: hypothetical protein IT293_05705 [Deltaproteobacteria bacterium]|nr:hypothetical protein [Deltaproteobacteria bacterium]
MSRAVGTATVVAYGSLMSGLGLASLAPLPVADARRVRLSGCRRGFGKLSQYGDRFAMVLEPTAADAPIRATDIDAATSTDPATGIDALALTLRIPELARVAQREGYRADALLALGRIAESRGTSLGAHLFALAEGVGHDVARYRRALADAVDYTSPHYVPHPVAIDGDVPALVFLPPGPEGSGRDDVVPIRVQTAETRVLTFRRAWSLKPNPSQLAYAAMCILGECHGLSLADLVGDLRAYPPLARLLDARLAPELAVERERFREVLRLGVEQYAARFPSAPRRAAFVGGA